MTTLHTPNRVILRAGQPDPDAERRLAKLQRKLVRLRAQAKDTQTERDELMAWMHADRGYPASRLRDVLQTTGHPISPDAVEKVLRRAK